MEDYVYRKKSGFGRGYLFGILTMLVILAAGITTWRASMPKGLTLKEDAEALLKLNEMVSLMDRNYLEEVDTEDLLNGAYKGMAEAVNDKYTRYFTQEEYQEYLQTTSGTFAGIGVTVQWDSDEEMLKVVEVHEGGPADIAGIQVGDLVYAVDGEVMQGTNLDETVARIKGEVGTDVTLDIVRDGQNIAITCTRALIEETTVDWKMLDDDIGYILISGFQEVTTGQFEEAMNALTDQGMQALILDLRGNPGGRLDVVVKIADMLLPEGVITYTMTRNEVETVYDSDPGSLLTVPLAVLIDEDSASASEILAGAIRDYEVGTLIGKTTFGKGIVQSTYTLHDGAALKMTMARYYTPNGDYIHGKGIAPDYDVDLPEGKSLYEVYMTEEDTPYQLALNLLKEAIGK